MVDTGGDGATHAVPTEDAVQALVDHFVSDLLPIRPSASEPPDDHQLLIAKQSTFENHDSFQHVTVPQKNYLLQASLQILQKKLAGLCQQQRLLEEEIAIYEMKMHTIINGGEDALESNAEFIIEACGDLCSRQTRAGGAVCSELRQPKMIKRRRLSEAVLSLQRQCQELDDICSENSWILPKYSVLPSFADGRFQAKITLKGMDFEFTGDGDLKGSPHAARESAAFHMLSRLRCNAEHSDQ